MISYEKGRMTESAIKFEIARCKKNLRDNKKRKNVKQMKIYESKIANLQKMLQKE